MMSPVHDKDVVSKRRKNPQMKRMSLSSDAILLPEEKHLLERGIDGEGSSILRTPDSTELIQNSDANDEEIPDDVIKRQTEERF